MGLQVPSKTGFPLIQAQLRGGDLAGVSLSVMAWNYRFLSFVFDSLLIMIFPFSSFFLGFEVDDPFVTSFPLQLVKSGRGVVEGVDWAGECMCGVSTCAFYL